MDPRYISDKNQKQILIGADLVFDIDIDFSIGGLKEALKITKSIFKQVSPGYKVEAFCFTGMKGFRLIFKDNIRLPTRLQERIPFLEKNRKLFIDKLHYNNKIDKACTIDAFRIIRVINTINGKTGIICTELPKEMIFSKIEDILPLIHTALGKATVPRTRKRMTRGVVKKTSPPRIQSKGVERFGTGSRPFFITNQCGKRLVPFFKYQASKGYKKELKRLHRIYDIGPIWLFKDKEYIYAYGIRTFQKRRLKKIYRASKSLLKDQFIKYGRQYFKIIPKLRFQEKIEFKTNSYCSKAHYNYLISRNIEKETNLYKFHKSTILKIIKAEYGNRRPV